MKIIKPKKAFTPFATVCSSAAFAFLASLVFDISLAGSAITFVLILAINIAVDYFHKKEPRMN